MLSPRPPWRRMGQTKLGSTSSVKTRAFADRRKLGNLPNLATACRHEGPSPRPRSPLMLGRAPMNCCLLPMAQQRLYRHWSLCSRRTWVPAVAPHVVAKSRPSSSGWDPPESRAHAAVAPSSSRTLARRDNPIKEIMIFWHAAEPLRWVVCWKQDRKSTRLNSSHI